ncbi:hypothetical protein M9H77_19090 [Catharanthus roseus]|uniref:Uncharacterized protein n=1 Tax=Catharanthus roseus TaxID=4058 RepID=A0ACC0B9E1_CATRO|nr:hypothetical protein M9H77_19090 [Catharanthus roseus]
MGERLLWNGALVWCLAGIDYEMPELDSDDLVLGSGPCPWSPTVALHINLGRSWAQQAAEVLGREFLDQMSPGCHTEWAASQNVQEVGLGQLCWTGEGLVDWMEDLFVAEGMLVDELRGGRGCVVYMGRLHRLDRFGK